MNRKNHFEDIYRKRKWGEYDTTLSGRGSSKDFVKNDIEYIKSIIKKYKIKSIVDVCGDFSWQEQFLEDYDGEYLGVDISETCLARIKNTKYQFKQLDICVDAIPDCDLFIARDVLFHLSDEDIHLFLNNVRNSNVSLLMVTTFVHENAKHNLTLPPFNLELIELYAGNANTQGYEHKHLGILKLKG